MILANEQDIAIYKEELAPFLPPRIFDAHVHIFQKDHLPPGYTYPEQSVYNFWGGEFPLDLWRQLMAELLPEQQVWCNFFPQPNLKADREKVMSADRKTQFAMVLVSPADPAETMVRRIEKNNAAGVKPYLNYAADHYRKKSADVEVLDMLTAEQLEYLNKKELAVTLHIPRPGRFADPVNQHQMIEVCQRYPKIKFIFAHIGRAYFMRNIQKSNINDFATLPNAYFDTAMVNSPEILRYTFDHFPAERVLFGTDSPIALLRGKSIEVNNQYAYLMKDKYKIGTAIIDTDGTLEYTTFFYEQLRAIIAATPGNDLEKVLFSNAQKLFTKGMGI